MERPARADRDTDRADTPTVQVFPLDEHRGQGRYPTYTPNSIIDNTRIQNGVANQIYQVNALLNFLAYIKF